VQIKLSAVGTTAALTLMLQEKPSLEEPPDQAAL